jgi:hypothetical protein
LGGASVPPFLNEETTLSAFFTPNFSKAIIYLFISAGVPRIGIADSKANFADSVSPLVKSIIAS